MKSKLDNNIEALAQNKTYNELSKTELELVRAILSQEEYENYYLLFKQVNTHFVNSEEKISKEIKETIFNSFTEKNKVKKVSRVNYHNPFVKAMLGAVAVAIVLVSINVFKTEIKKQPILSDNDFLNYTHIDHYGLNTETVEEVTLTLQNMDFQELVKVVDAPSCDW
jgi:hypothetical protein